jgi:hypothetical protein
MTRRKGTERHGKPLGTIFNGWSSGNSFLHYFILREGGANLNCCAAGWLCCLLIEQTAFMRGSQEEGWPTERRAIFRYNGNLTFFVVEKVGYCF